MNMCFHCRRSVLLLAVFLLFCLPSYAQDASGGREKTVHGTVVDESGEPVIGCAVYQSDNVGGGVATNVDGVFVIKVSQDVTELVFEALGYEKVTLPVDKVRRVRLRSESQKLDDVVVTGIFTRKKDSFTGSVQTISSEEIKRVSNSNVVQALKNLDPSLLVLENLEAGSNPNAMASMQLRGASSLMTEANTDTKSTFVSQGNTPLFILDGFETTIEKITDMDMNRVQSITILKDASAKAIYGSKGANGVIVIETKALLNERTLVTYNGNVSIEAPDLSSYNLCNALEKLEIEKREGFYDLADDSYSIMVAQQVYNQRLKRALEGESTYWLSKPLRVGIGHKHSLEVEMGSKDLKALATFGYNDVQGVMKGSYRDVISGDINLSYRRGPWTFRNIMSFSYMKNEDSPWGTFDEYAELNPYFTPYDSEGNLKKNLTSGLVTPDGINVIQLGKKQANTMWNATVNTTHSNNYVNFTDNFYVEYRFKEFLRLVARIGVDSKRTESRDFLPAEHTVFSNYLTVSSERLKAGLYDITNGKSLNLSGDFNAQFNHTFAGKHDVFGTLQYNISEFTFEEITMSTEGYPNSNMTSPGFARSYSTTSTPKAKDGLNRNLGFLLTGGYSYDNRYMADATIKFSGSSVFGTNNRWGTFWSAGVAWNMHNEAFMKGASSWLKQLKVRYSIGSSGNQNYSTNVSLPVYKYDADRYWDSFAAAYLDNMANPSLGWEEKLDNNLGLDLRTKHFNVTLDLYVSDTRNLVFSRGISPSTGYSFVNDNLGLVRNQGVELSLSYMVWQKGANYFTIFSRTAFNDNRILRISESMQAFNETQLRSAQANGTATPVVRYYDGMPLHSLWVVRSLGVDPYDGKEVFLDRGGNMTKTWSPYDLVNAGSYDPLVNGNFGFNGEIHGFGLSLVMTFKAGGWLYNKTLLDKVEGADINYNVDRRVFDGRWAQRGDNVPYAKSFYNEKINTQATSRFVQRNDVLDISSLSVYYEFPSAWVRKLHMDRLRATLYANDLYTFSAIEIERGTAYPYARTFSLSLTATF